MVEVDPLSRPQTSGIKKREENAEVYNIIKIFIT